MIEIVLMFPFCIVAVLAFLAMASNRLPPPPPADTGEEPEWVKEGEWEAHECCIP